MHAASFELMRQFAADYVEPPCSVVDVGSMECMGTFRPLFDGCTYTGIDIVSGPNVDRVVEPYDYGPERYDVVI